MIYLKYSGTIDASQIQRLIEELTDIACVSGWKYETIREDFQTLTSKAKNGKTGRNGHDAIRDFERHEVAPQIRKSSDIFMQGISIYVDGSSEPLKIVFDRNGRLCTISSYATERAREVGSRLVIKRYEFIYYPYQRINTHNAESHKKMVRILDYLKKKYVPDMLVIDTSFYWDTRDDEELIVRMYKASRGIKKRDAAT